MNENVIDRLQNLKAVLYKIMGPSSVTCAKYTNALEDAIDMIDNHKIAISTPIFRLTAETTKIGSIIIDLYSSEDEHLQTIEFNPEDLIDEEIYGDA